jgi:hypothetical protein
MFDMQIGLFPANTGSGNPGNRHGFASLFKKILSNPTMPRCNSGMD